MLPQNCPHDVAETLRLMSATGAEEVACPDWYVPMDGKAGGAAAGAGGATGGSGAGTRLPLREALARCYDLKRLRGPPLLQLVLARVREESESDPESQRNGNGGTGNGNGDGDGDGDGGGNSDSDIAQQVIAEQVARCERLLAAADGTRDGSGPLDGLGDYLQQRELRDVLADFPAFGAAAARAARRSAAAAADATDAADASEALLACLRPLLPR